MPLNHKPVSPKYVEQMKLIAEGLNDLLKPAGFVLLIFDQVQGNTEVNYISNCEREDMVVAMKEVVAKFEGHAHDPHTTEQ